MKLGLTMMACLTVAAAPAYGQAQTAPAPAPAQTQTAPAPAGPKNPSDRMICRQDNEIGSLVHKKRVCLTAAQWRQASQETGQEFERHVSQRSGASTR